MSDVRNDLVNTPLEPTAADRVSTHGLLMAVEAEPGTDLNRIVFDIMAVCVKNPAIRNMDVEHLGEIELYDDSDGTLVDTVESPIDHKRKGN